MNFLINAFFTDVLQFSRSESKIRRVSGWVTSVRKIGFLTSSKRSWLNHVVRGGKSMYFWVNIYFTNILARSHEADSNKACRLRRMSLQTVGIVRGITPSMRDR